MDEVQATNKDKTLPVKCFVQMMSVRLSLVIVPAQRKTNLKLI